MLARPKQRRTGPRTVVEAPVRAKVFGLVDRLEQIVLTRWIARLRILLCFDVAERKMLVEHRRHQLVGGDRLVSRRADKPLLAAGMRRLPDREGGNFGLIDRSYRTWRSSHMRANPVELRRVHTGQLHHR